MKINRGTINKVDALEKKHPDTWNRKQRRYLQAVTEKFVKQGEKNVEKEEVA
jgi:hypothetical protein